MQYSNVIQLGIEQIIAASAATAPIPKVVMTRQLEALSLNCRKVTIKDSLIHELRISASVNNDVLHGFCDGIVKVL